MKNFTKLLMAVVLLVSYSCVQDTTEDLAPVISEPNGGSGEVKTLQVSMPVPSRTSLGEKVDGKYPVSWCENDVLAVNGKPTTSITISEEASNVAVFDLPLGITIPYHIVYPYQGDGVVVNAQSEAYPVVFASEQNHTEGSFANGSAPMYAWSNGFDDVHMEHLATALRFSIKAKAGESVELKYISVSTVDGEPISGTFDVYCADNGEFKAGALAAREDAVSTVFYNFPNEDGSEGTYTLTDSKVETFFIAVPKGEYSRFEVNFVSTTGDVYTETFDASGDKQLLGGKVREFPEVVFEANSKMFLIGNDADMLTFAGMVADKSFAHDGALLVSDIDMTEAVQTKPWTPIEGYTSVFEGRNYTIKGLTTPLFGEAVVATISNVKVEGNLVEESNGKVGLIARSLTVDGDKVGTIFNCSAKGSIEYKNESLAVNDKFDCINVGGIVGGVYGGSVTLSESNVDVTISKVAGAEAASKTFIPCVGGVVGYACVNGENNPIVVKNASNGVVIWDDQSKSEKVTPYIGGVAGYVTAGTFSENVNSGKLYINEPMYDLDWGGVIGAASVAVTGCENKGSLTINEQITKANIGGVLGKLEAGSVVSCENSGELLFDEKFCVGKMEGTTVVSVGTCNIGGVVAYAQKGTELIQDCTNSGSITYLGSCAYEKEGYNDKNSSMRCGGVIGYCWSELVENCHNLENASLYIGGDVAGNGDIQFYIRSVDIMTGIAGVIGSRCGTSTTAPYVTRDCSNKGEIKYAFNYCGSPYIYAAACIGVFESDIAERCNNDGVLKFEVSVAEDMTSGTATTMNYINFVSGLFGCLYSENSVTLKDCKNTKDTIVDNANAGYLYMSGISSLLRFKTVCRLENCANEGNILVGKNVNVAYVYVGGILSQTLNATITYTGCYNAGNVEVESNVSGEACLGAIIGYSTKSNKSTESVNDAYNEGTVKFTGNSSVVYMGGYAGWYDEDIHTISFVNKKSADIQFLGQASTAIYVGGVAGTGGTKSRTITGGEFTGMYNEGNITILGSATNVYASGCFGAIFTKKSGIGGLTNNGVVTVPENTAATAYSESIYMGGVFGYANMGVSYPSTVGTITKEMAVHNCNNTGSVIYSGIARDGAYVGGIVGCAEQAPIFECENTGEVHCDGHAGDSCPRYSEADEKKAPHAYNNIENMDIAVGGIVGQTDLDLSGCLNNGDVTHECVLNPLRVDYVGELATSRFDVGGIAGRVFVKNTNVAYYQMSMNGLINNGKVTILGTPSATNNTPSVDLESNGEYQWTDVDDGDRLNRRLYTRVNVSGLVGRMMDYSKKSGDAGQDKDNEFFMSGCINKGAVSVPEAGGAKCLSVAGAVADLLVSQMTFEGVQNHGKISVENAGVGTIIAGKQRMHAFFINLGGIVATYFDFRYFGNDVGDFTPKIGNGKHNMIFKDCTNEGDIHYGEIGASVYQCAGGMLAQVLHCCSDRCANIGVEGYGGSKWYKSEAHVTFERCKNSGNIDYKSTIMASLSSHYNYNYAGGILGTGNLGHGGTTQHYGTIFLKFDHCENIGNIQWDRSNGVASDNADPFYTAVGGIVGHYTGGLGLSYHADYDSGIKMTRVDACNAEIISCKNSGRIHGFSGVLGGIIGVGQWYVKITGTPDDPTINTGDIVVIREGNSVVTRNRYGRKYMYAGGIAGYMTESTAVGNAVASASGANNGHPAYMPEHMYCRIEHAVNEGAVGSTGYAGGIAGYYYSAVEPSNRTGKVIDHRGGMEFCRNTGDIYALEESTINVGAIVGKPRMMTYTGSDTDDITNHLLSQEWQIGVRNCEVGGSVLRGAADKFEANEENLKHLIYGGYWEDTFTSVTDSEFDGCTVYVAPVVDETPEGGEGGEEGAEPTAKR